jgi:galactonate dehydratase
MKITRLETIHVKPRWLFLKIHTDEGIVGLGEPVVEGRARTVEAAVHEMGRYLIGKDPRQIEDHWQTIYRGQFYRGGPILTSALSGIEQALWDILGKWLDVPVYQLLGGAVRDKIRMYGWLSADSYGSYIESAKVSASDGFSAFKIGLPRVLRILDTPQTIDEIVTLFASTREALGNEVDLAIDFHGRCSPAMSVRIAKALEPFTPLFIEEPVLPENVDALAWVARSTSIPIATGERLFTKWAFWEVLKSQAAAVLQPDISHCGGIMEAKKIAAMAECNFAAIAPHCPLGPIALAACLQLDACIPNFLAQEHFTLGDGYITEPFVVENGYIALPTKPGLGIELDEEQLQNKLFDGDWQAPIARLEDNSITDW